MASTAPLPWVYPVLPGRYDIAPPEPFTVSVGAGYGDRIGVKRGSTWYLDNNGNEAWDGCGADGCISNWGLPGDLPVAGDWNGDGVAELGVFRGGNWYWI